MGVCTNTKSNHKTEVKAIRGNYSKENTAATGVERQMESEEKLKNKKVIEPKKTNDNNNNNNSNNNDNNINDIKINQLAITSDVLVARNEINPEKIYNKTQILGSGAFGEVWLVKHKDLKKDFAMKLIQKKKNKPSEEKEILNEIEILKNLDHPKILKIIDFFSTSKLYYIITEYCPDGELFNEIIKVGKFDEGQSAFIMNQIFKAITYCHSLNIIHRDLKPENIMITDREKNGCLQVKIIDFGTAKISEKGQSENRYVGSSYYMAPEVIKRKYNEKCDLWSCGVIMYILLSGRPPFDGNDDNEILENVKIGEYDMKSYPFPTLSEECKDLIKKLLTYEPNKRISAADALKHPWFKTAEFKKKDQINIVPPSLAKQMIQNLQKYRSDNMLRIAVIAYLVHHNTNIEQCVEAGKLFNKIDLNNNGRIEKEELIKGIEKYWNLTRNEVEKQVDELFNHIDTDHNGFIEYEEFVRAAVDPKIFMSRNYLKFAFGYFDRDNSGDISLEEIKKRFLQTSKNNTNEVEKQLKEMFGEIDINGDGSISFEEFCKMMKNIIKS